MKRMFEKRPTASMAVAFLALVAALGGSAAALPGKNRVDSGDIKNNSVRSADIRNGTIASKDLSARTKRSLRGKTGPAGQPGPAGQRGPAGPAGPAGTPATKLFAVVDSNGTLARGSGATEATSVGTGEYTVRFNQNVRGCAYVATIGLSASEGTSPSGEITVAGEFGGGDPAAVNGVFVSTRSSTGASANRGFHLAVFC